jgi:hypothetical protein
MVHRLKKCKALNPKAWKVVDLKKAELKKYKALNLRAWDGTKLQRKKQEKL